MAKIDNNLYKVVWKGKTYWYTKMDYIRRLTGIQTPYLHRLLNDEEYARKRNCYITIEDGSEIKYKDINNIEDLKIN